MRATDVLTIKPGRWIILISLVLIKWNEKQVVTAKPFVNMMLHRYSQRFPALVSWGAWTNVAYIIEEVYTPPNWELHGKNNVGLPTIHRYNENVSSLFCSSQTWYLNKACWLRLIVKRSHEPNPVSTALITSRLHKNALFERRGGYGTIGKNSESNQILLVTYTWLADVNAIVAKCLCF
jgi:hypothetical protein